MFHDDYDLNHKLKMQTKVVDAKHICHEPGV